MIFSSPRFLLFLCGTLLVLAIPLRHEIKKRVLLVASCIFYAAWDYRYLALLFAVSVIITALRESRRPTSGTRGADG